MRGLLVKDFQILGVQKKVIILIILLSFFLGATNGEWFVVAYLAFLAAMFSCSTISYDEMQNGYTFLMTLPITRKQYVAEKYLSGFMITFAGWLIGCLISVLFICIRRENIRFGEFALPMGLVFMVATVFLSIMIPTMLKYGPEKGRIMWMIVIGVIVLLVYVSSKILSSYNISITGIFNRLMERHIVLMYVIFISIAVAGVYISYLISVHVMNQKEL